MKFQLQIHGISSGRLFASLLCSTRAASNFFTPLFRYLRRDPIHLSSRLSLKSFCFLAASKGRDLQFPGVRSGINLRVPFEDDNYGGIRIFRLDQINRRTLSKLKCSTSEELERRMQMFVEQRIVRGVLKNVPPCYTIYLTVFNGKYYDIQIYWFDNVALS
jgi:hypothetical protein